MHTSGAAGAGSGDPRSISLASYRQSLIDNDETRAGGTQEDEMGALIRRSIVVAAMLLALPAYAADISAADTIVVTATRGEMTLRDVTVPMRVITREDIELSLATDLAELLRFEAGIDIGRNGGPGQATSVFIQGTESNHTLVLVDGVRINPGTIGGAAIQHIAPEMIERVEIVKGARSSLFGSDAIGGVINILTRDASSPYLDLGVGGGSFDTQTGHASGGNSGEFGKFSATLHWQDTSGFSPRIESDIKRGYDNLSFNLVGSRNFGGNEISLRHWQAAGNVEYLDFFLNPVDQDFRNAATALQLDSTLGERGTSKLIVSHVVDEVEQIQSPDFVESKRVSLDWQYTHAFDKHTLSTGLYYVDENAQSLSFGEGFDEDTRVRAVFIQDEINAGRHRAFAALRVTDHETFGNETTWNAEYAYVLSDDWTLTAGLGRAFRAPDATDRYGFGGNPELAPELSNGAQLGLRYAAGGRHNVDVEIFATDLENLIEFDLQSFVLINIDEAKIRGVQLGYEYRGEAFTLRSEIVNQSAENRSTGARLLRRAERSASLSYTQNIGNHRLGVSVLAADDREDFGGVVLDSYVVTNLTAQFQISRSLKLNARIENLFDERYETAANFRMQELSGFVELEYQWR